MGDTSPKDIVRYTYLPPPTWEGEYEPTQGDYCTYRQSHHNLKLVFDGKTEKLKTIKHIT